MNTLFHSNKTVYPTDYTARFERMLFDYFCPRLMGLIKKKVVRVVARKVYKLFESTGDLKVVYSAVNTILLTAGVSHFSIRLLE